MKKIMLSLYQDEYDWVHSKAEKDRVSMNKLFQFWIRDEMKKELPIKYDISSSPVASDKPAIIEHKPESQKFEMPQSFGSHKK